MSVIFFLIGVGVLVAGGFLVAFIWAVKSGQYDDDYTPSVRMLFDDSKPADSQTGSERNSPGDSTEKTIKLNREKTNNNKI
jgi:cbb3-type cytochrome oxidase maturation protein